MWGRRLITAAALTMVAVVATAPPATAAGPGEPFYGDLNQDGLVDRITAGAADVGCEVRIANGRPGGGYLPAVSRRYLPEPRPIYTYCPDLGTVADLRGDGVPELVLTFDDYAKAGDLGTVVVVKNLKFAYSVFAGWGFPYMIETADFNGDGREDVYADAPECAGFIGLFSDADGRLRHGTQWPAQTVRTVVDDFDRDGADEAVVAYQFPDHCGGGETMPPAAGVVALSGDGRIQHLERDLDVETSYPWWFVERVQANKDSYPDIRTQKNTTGRVNYHLGTGTGTFVKAPRVAGDQIYLTSPKRTVIDVAANDWITAGASIRITEAPRYGQVTVTADRKLSYVPDPTRRLTDRFAYQVTEVSGEKAATSVYVRWRN